MRFAGLDLGGSFLKAAVLDTETGELGEVRRRPFPAFLSGRLEGRREVDAQEIVDAARELLEETIHLAPECGGIWVSGQMHGVVLCDGRGRARSPFVSWQDQRSLERGSDGERFEVLKARIGPEDIAALGNELRPGVAITTLDVFQEDGMLPDGLYPVPLSDFVLASIGEMSPVTSPTQGASLGAYNVAAGCWHTEVLRKLGLDRLCWPRICPSLEPWGEVRLAGRTLPCLPTVGDQQAALLGAGIQPGELSLNIATGSQASALCHDAEGGDFQLRPFFDGTFLRTLTHLPAGRALNALLSLLRELAEVAVSDPWKRISEAVDATPQTDISADLSFFSCSTGREGSLLHLHEENLRTGPLFRAAFEAMAENYTHAATRIFSGEKWSRVVFSGGVASRLEPLRKVILSRLGQAHRMAGSEEDALFGLMALARAAERGCPALQAAKELRALKTP